MLSSVESFLNLEILEMMPVSATVISLVSIGGLEMGDVFHEQLLIALNKKETVQACTQEKTIQDQLTCTQFSKKKIRYYYH